MLIIKALQQELNQAVNAANEAHAAAVDDQSVAETQYDTLAIEASYLAEGQSRRVQTLKAAINTYRQLTLKAFTENNAITLTALVQLAKDNQTQHWFFIGPAAGGFRFKIAEQHITVITEQSPMGSALLDKYQDDNVDIIRGNNLLNDHIVCIQ